MSACGTVEGQVDEAWARFRHRQIPERRGQTMVGMPRPTQGAAVEMLNDAGIGRITARDDVCASLNTVHGR
jgi:hypothetical protein